MLQQKSSMALIQKQLTLSQDITAYNVYVLFRLFFEHLYNTLIDVLHEAFIKLQKRREIEEEIGLLFRSRHFNLYARTNSPARSVDTLSVKELYSIKNETLNRALNAKLLSSLYEKPKALEVQVLLQLVDVLMDITCSICRSMLYGDNSPYLLKLTIQYVNGHNMHGHICMGVYEEFVVVSLVGHSRGFPYGMFV